MAVTVSDLLDLALQRSGYAQEGLTPSASSTKTARQLLGALLPQYGITVESTADEAVLTGTEGGHDPELAKLPIVNLLAAEICLHYGLMLDPAVMNSRMRDRGLVRALTVPTRQLNPLVGNNLWNRAHAGYYWYQRREDVEGPKLALPE